MKPEAKREVRGENESSKLMDAGASTSNRPTIRVLNHKDYKTWKVSIGSDYAYSSITVPFLTVFTEDAAKPKYIFDYDNIKQASYALMKTKH